MVAEAGPWALFAAFVAGLVALVFWGLRLFGTGKIVQGPVYDDARTDRDKALHAANTAIEAATGMMASVGQLSTQVGVLAATVERLARSQGEQAEQVAALRMTVDGLRAAVEGLVRMWQPERDSGRGSVGRS